MGFLRGESQPFGDSAQKLAPTSLSLSSRSEYCWLLCFATLLDYSNV